MENVEKWGKVNGRAPKFIDGGMEKRAQMGAEVSKFEG